MISTGIGCHREEEDCVLVCFWYLTIIFWLALHDTCTLAPKIGHFPVWWLNACRKRNCSGCWGPSGKPWATTEAAGAWTSPRRCWGTTGWPSSACRWWPCGFCRRCSPWRRWGGGRRLRVAYRASQASDLQTPAHHFTAYKGYVRNVEIDKRITFLTLFRREKTH